MAPHFVSLSKKHNRQVRQHVCQTFIIVIKVIFARGRPFFIYNFFKMAGMCGTLAIKEKKQFFFRINAHQYLVLLNF